MSDKFNDFLDEIKEDDECITKSCVLMLTGKNEFIIKTMDCNCYDLHVLAGMLQSQIIDNMLMTNKERYNISEDVK